MSRGIPRNFGRTTVMIALSKIPAAVALSRREHSSKHGFGVSIGRRHVSVDFWRTKEKRLFTRCCTNGYRHYFEILSPSKRDLSLSGPEEIERVLQMPVLNWLLEAMDDCFEE